MRKQQLLKDIERAGAATSRGTPVAFDKLIGQVHADEFSRQLFTLGNYRRAEGRDADGMGQFHLETFDRVVGLLPISPADVFAFGSAASRIFSERTVFYVFVRRRVGELSASFDQVGNFCAEVRPDDR